MRSEGSGRGQPAPMEKVSRHQPALTSGGLCLSGFPGAWTPENRNTCARLLPASASCMLLENKTFHFSGLQAFYQKPEFLEELPGAEQKSRCVRPVSF